MGRKFEIVAKPRKASPHRCVSPGWLSRFLRGFRKGAIIKCRCGKYRELRYCGYDLCWRTLLPHEEPTSE